MEQNQQETATSVEQKELSPEELTALREKRTNWFKEQIPYLEAQRNYFELLSQIEQLKANKLKAEYEQMSLAYAMTQPQQDIVEHTVTQEDLNNNPDLVGKVNVGDVVNIPKPDAEPQKSRTLKK